MNRWLWVILPVVSLLTAVQAPLAQVNAQVVNISFRDEVAPILAKKCLHCHGPDVAEADFRIDVADSVADYVVGGDLESSDLYLMLKSTEEGYRMPPDLGDHLDDGELSSVEGWIAHGAKYEEVDNWKEKRFEGSDLAEVDSVGGALWALLGRFHPALVHFPIALLTVAAFFAVFAFGNTSMDKAAIYCLVLGTLGSIAAAAAGWGFAEYRKWPDYRLDFASTEKTVDSVAQDNQKPEQSETEGEELGGKMVDPAADMPNVGSFAIFKGTDRSMHRWGGVAVCMLSLVVTLLAMYVRRNPDNSQLTWKLSTVVLAAMVGWVGHQGGEIHYGDDLYDQPIKRLQELLEKGKAEATDAASSNTDSEETEVDELEDTAETPSTDETDDTAAAEEEEDEEEVVEAPSVELTDTSDDESDQSDDLNP